MAVTFSNLIKAITESQLVTSTLSLLESAGFPITDWSSTSTPRALIQVFARVTADLAATITNIAKSGFVLLAEGEWLDLLAESQQNETRKPAIQTKRTLRLVNNSGSPVVVTPGSLVAVSAAGLRYTNEERDDSNDTITAGAGDYLDFPFAAEELGAAQNNTSATWELSTPLAGVTVTEPTLTLTQTGADQESDTEFRARIVAKWGAIGVGNDDFYKYHALAQSNEVRKVNVVASFPDPGWVTVILAGQTAGVGAGVVSAIQDFFDPADHKGMAPSCVRVDVDTASVYTISLIGTVYAKAEELDSAQGAFTSALTEYEKILRIGALVSRERLISLIMQQLSYDDANDVTITTPSNDVALTYGQVAKFDTSGLTWTAV